MKYIFFILILLSCKSKLKQNEGVVKDKATAGEAKSRATDKTQNYPKNKANEIVVIFKPGAEKRILRGKMYKTNGHFFQINVADIDKALLEFMADPDVEWAGLNPVHTTQFVPNDPQYTSGAQWNLATIGAPAMWNSGNTGRKDAYVVVLDEGSAYWFCDLNSKLWTNQEEMNGVAGVDDDNNGYIDDKRGWNWFDGSSEMYTGNNDHGTWCESMIGAESGNNLYIASVLPNVKIISLKFLADFGYDTEAAKAVDYVIWLKQNKGLNIVAISNSWGGGSPTPILKDAIHRAALADINFVCAAGNSGLNTATYPMYPAAYDEPNILSVGASNPDNTKAFFSNYGTQGIAAVDLFAPGVNIPAIIPVNHQEAVGIYSGTSMATPQVAAAIAAVASIHPEMNYQQRQDAVLNATKVITALTPYTTHGLLNLNNPVFLGNTETVIPEGTCGIAPVLDTEKPSTMVLTLDSVNENPATGTALLYISWPQPTDNNPILGLTFNMTPTWVWFLQGNAWTGFAFSVPMDRLYTITGRARDTWGNVSNPSNVITKDYSGSPPPPPPPPPPPVNCSMSSALSATSFSLNVTLSWTISVTGDCSVESTRLERKKGNGVYSPIAFNPSSPFQNTVLTPGSYWYRLMIQSSTGQTFYSNERNIKVSKNK